MSIIPNIVRRKYGMTVTLEKLSVMLSFWVKTVARSHDMHCNGPQRLSEQAGERQDTSCQLYQTLLGESTAWPWHQTNLVWCYHSEWKQWKDLMICWALSYHSQNRISKQAGARQDTSCQWYQTLLGESTAWPWHWRNWVWCYHSEWKQWQQIMICWALICNG